MQPFWSPDGSRILFIDKPSPDAATGLYAINPEQPGSPPEFYLPRPGLYSSDMSLVVYPENGLAVVENLMTGERWPVNTNGNAPAFSPDGTRMLWQVGGATGATNNRLSELHVSKVDGTEARYVATYLGGGPSAWFPDSQRLLVVARPSTEALERALSVFDLADGSTRELARAERIGSTRLSRAGSWAAFTVTFDPNPGQNGIWLARTDGGDLKRLDSFGAYQWRDDGRLLLIPMDPGRGSHVLWEIDAASGAVRPLTDPSLMPFSVANGDWAVSPDGTRVVFVNAADRAIWLLRLQ